MTELIGNPDFVKEPSKPVEWLKPQQVVDYYVAIHPNPDEEAYKMINLYRWQKQNLPLKNLLSYKWYFDPNVDKSHITWELTEQGKKQTLYEVANSYLKQANNGINMRWKNAEKIEAMIKDLHVGARFPDLIAVKNGYPGAPWGSFIDGVHRSLALAAYELQNPQNNITVPIYVGQKHSLFDRLKNRF